MNAIREVPACSRQPAALPVAPAPKRETRGQASKYKVLFPAATGSQERYSKAAWVSPWAIPWARAVVRASAVSGARRNDG